MEFDTLLMMKHLNSVVKNKKFKKNGLITYSYNEGKDEPGYYFSPTLDQGNIGDYIQSYASMQFIKQIDEYIDRDLISLYQKDPINLIMNAWWFLWHKNYKFSDRINPLFISFHLNNPRSIKNDTLEYLKSHGPIGCRDYNTRDFLLKNGVDAYFSGCLTLTLGNTFKRSLEIDNSILFVDYNKGKNEYIDNTIDNILKLYEECDIDKITHCRPLTYTVEENLKYSHELIERYSRAKLVITSRLHCALPCLSIGTPVIFVIYKYDKKRYKGLEQLLNIVGINEYGQYITRIKKSDNGLIVNSNLYRKYSDFLSLICNTFMKNTKVKDIDHFFYLLRRSECKKDSLNPYISMNSPIRKAYRFVQSALKVFLGNR